jgi:hypothetical protein
MRTAARGLLGDRDAAGKVFATMIAVSPIMARAGQRMTWFDGTPAMVRGSELDPL